MKRPHYKSMYLIEKASREGWQGTYILTLNKVIDELRRFETIEVIDEIHNNIRYVKIKQKQNDKYFVIALNLDMLEDEVE